jgi:hypothetical protein
MADNFDRHASGLDSPASGAAAVTPSNSTDLSTFSRGLYIGGAGNITVDMVGGQTGVLFSNLVAGSVYPLRVSRVYATGTTATGIVALW